MIKKESGFNNFTAQYEKKVKTPYSELGEQDKKNFNIWGNVKRGDKWLNIYNDDQLIKEIFTDSIIKARPNQEEPLTVADFGGAEGTVINLIAKQLKDKGYKINPLNLDINSKSLELMKKKFPEQQGAQADLLKLPVKKSSIDAGILRFTLPYFSREKQAELLEELHSSLKPGGKIIIFQDGAYDKKRGENYNQLFAESSAAQGSKTIEEVKKNRYFTSGEELREVAEQKGFKTIRAKELTEELEGYFSPEAYASRFQMNQKQLNKLIEVYKKWKESGKLEFSDSEDIYQVAHPLLFCILEKLKITNK